MAASHRSSLCFGGQYRILLLLTFLFIITGFVDGRRGGGGGYRGGARYSGSRYSTYRSGTTRYSTYRSGTTRYSTYRAYIPATRYSRNYYGYSGYYFYYYNMYYNYYRGSAYYRQYGTMGTSKTVCENYAVNANGTTLGTFYCPLPFEPDTFDSCCGDQYMEYCCEKKLTGGEIAGIVIGSLIGVGIIVLIIFCIVKSCKTGEKRVNPDSSSHITRQPRHNQNARGNGVATTMTSGSSPYGPPTYNANPAHNQGYSANTYSNPAYEQGGGFSAPPPYGTDKNAYPSNGVYDPQAPPPPPYGQNPANPMPPSYSTNPPYPTHNSMPSAE